jgi:hypothetical protein
MAARNCYVDVPGFVASNPVVPVAQLLGGNTRLSAAVAVGATSLPVTNSGGFTASQLVYILDGPNSELVFADATNPTPSGATLTIAANTAGGTGLQFAHNAGVSVSSGGVSGDLGDILLTASAWAENYCNAGSPSDRGFFSTSRSETIQAPSSRAYIDRSYGLTLRPSWFPVTAITSVQLESSPGVGVVAYDPSLAEFDTSAQRLVFPLLIPLSVPSPGYPTLTGWYISRSQPLWARITYTAGFPQDALPYDFMRAVALIAREYVSYVMNPTGAALVRTGDAQIMQRLRGSGNRESSADGIFLTQAKALLTPYKATFI